jgi:ABC-type sugar transport system ATPase subunit
MRTEITSLHERLAATMIYVTHDQVEAMTMADKIVVLRAGRVEQVGAPLDLYNRPANRFVAGFIGSPQMNFLPATVAGRDAAGVAVTLPGGRTLQAVAADAAPAAGSALTLGVRPEHLALAAGAADTHLSLTVLHLEQLGAHSLLHGVVADGDTRVTVHVAGQTRVRAGDTVDVTIAAGDVRLFAGDDAGLAL